MHVPNGAVQGLRSASITMLAVGVAFLGFWAYGPHTGDVEWASRHFLVLSPVFLGYLCLGAVPWLATNPAPPDLSANLLTRARGAYLIGSLLLLLAVLMAIAIDRIFE